MKVKQPKYKWNKLYTLILVANAAYIVAFYLITIAF